MTQLEQQLRKVCSVRTGRGTTAGQTIISAKPEADLDAVELLVMTVFPVAVRVSASMFVVQKG